MKHVKGISHIAYNVTDLDKAIDFYCNILEFEKAFEITIPENFSEILPGHPAAAIAGQVGIVYLKSISGDYIELFRPMPDADLTSGGPNFYRMGYVHLSLIVEDLDGYLDFLRQQGVTIDSEKTMGPDNTYTAWIKDPDGNRIELMEYTKDSFQVIYNTAK